MSKYFSLVLVGTLLITMILGCNLQWFPKKMRTCEPLTENGITPLTIEKTDRDGVCRAIGVLNNNGTITVNENQSRSISYETLPKFTPDGKHVLYFARYSNPSSSAINLYVMIPKRDESPATKEVFFRIADEILKREVNQTVPNAIKSKLFNDEKNFLREQLKAENKFIYFERRTGNAKNRPDNTEYVVYEMSKKF